MLTIKPHKRTIYIQYFGGYTEPWKKTRLERYILNIPKITFSKINEGIRCQVFNENNVQCIPPFTNINASTQNICFGSACDDPKYLELKKAANLFFTSHFTPSYYTWLDCYLNGKLNEEYDKDTNEVSFTIMHEFYLNWQNTGKLKLIEC